MAIKQVFNSSAELNYPKVLPTLDLNFANTKTLDPRITFTRASGGSYVSANGLIKYAGVNEARFDHDPVTGESLGLLIEEARTNLLTSSNNFGSGDANYGITANADVSPDGTTNASLIFEKTTLSFKFYTESITAVIGTTYCGSVFVKYSGSNLYGRLKVGENNTIIINLINGSILSSTGTCGVIPYPNGWYRIYVVWTATTTIQEVQIFLMNRTGSNSLYQGDGSSGYYIYGIQAEVGSFPTSYIPTQGSTRTRAGDRALITDKNFSDFYRQDEGSIFIEFLNTPNSTLFPTIYSISDPITGAGQNRVRLVKNVSSNAIRISDVTNGIVQSAYDIGSGYNVFDNIKAIRTYGFKNYIGSVNGTTPRPPGIFNVTNPTPSKLMAIMSIGTVENGLNSINAPIKRLTYYPKALPPSQLQALTS
jgi:hypothetical protein